MSVKRIDPVGRLIGGVTVPGDKSISHRYAILGAMAEGETTVVNFSSSADCHSTLRCLAGLGIGLEGEGSRVRITSPGWRNLQPPASTLDAGNSGTTLRLLSGVLAGRPFVSRITGDDSLVRRPMRRIIEPLSLMGARIEARQGEFPPLEIYGTHLKGVEYKLPVASAQVKSCILLAGLEATGETTVVESIPSRDHTERALPLFGVPVFRDDTGISVKGPCDLTPVTVSVPGDISSAMFWVVAALLLPGSRVRCQAVGVNPTRAALLELLEESGALIHREAPRQVGTEPVCDLVVEGDEAFVDGFPGEIGGGWIPKLIDEIPVLAVLGSRLPHGLYVRDAAELRKKESDRIHAVVENLRAVGVPADELEDGFRIHYVPEVGGGLVRTFGDHRIAMAFSVLGLISREGVELDDPDCVAVSYPEFFENLQALSGRVESESGR